MHDIDVLTVIHDAAGCTGTYTGYDEPRWFGSRSPIFCSGLRDMDAIMGDDGKLLSKIKAFIADRVPRAIAIVGSPVPMVVGFDFEGFAALVESETRIPSFGFPTNGLGTYEHGHALTYEALERRFVEDSGRSGGVNILGASPLDDMDGEAIDYLARLANRAGLGIVSVWGSISDLDSISRSGSAAVNWVTSSAAIPLARKLQSRFGQAFVTGLPIGSSEERRLVSELTAAAISASMPDRGAGHSGIPSAASVDGGRSEPEQAIPRPGTQGGTTLVVAEAVAAASMAACLRQDMRVGTVLAGTMFGSDGAMEATGVRRLHGEAELAELLADPLVDRFVGDPLLAGLAPPGKRLEIIPVPHRAVSARLYHDSRARIFGNRGESILNSFQGGSIHDATARIVLN